jgi:hypothetical protein
MYDAKVIEKQQADLNTIFDYIATFIKDYKDVGYLTIENRTTDSIDIIVGVQRFTIHGQIWLSHNKIIFKVYGWEFDLSSVTKYTAKNIDELTFIKNGGTVLFLKSKLDKNGRETSPILFQLGRVDNQLMTETLLNEFEAYTDRWLEKQNNI